MRRSGGEHAAADTLAKGAGFIAIGDAEAGSIEGAATHCESGVMFGGDVNHCASACCRQCPWRRFRDAARLALRARSLSNRASAATARNQTAAVPRHATPAAASDR